jgi:HAD superfamily hydrolase (TIGR01509 family)
MNHFRGVIFDMDGVLCDSEPFIAEAACRMFAETHGVQPVPADFHPFIGTGEDRFLGGVAEKFGVHLVMPRDKDRTYAIYLEIIRGRLHPLPGAVPFIADCRQRGLKLAVATSADRIKLDGNLREIGLPPETFDVCVTGSDTVRKKPDPEIFLTAAQRLALPPASCLVVEDAPNGIRAGKAAGCACLGLTTTFAAATLTAAGADWLARDLSQTPPTIFARGLGSQIRT